MKLRYQKKQTRRVTIKDLAEDLGLSVGAVSQALNPRDNINIKLKPETIERVRAHARQLNYRPHAGASSIRSRHFSNIGYMVAQHTLDRIEPTSAEFGIHDAALEHNFRVTMLRMPSEVAKNPQAVSRVFNESHLDALIVLDEANIFSEYEKILVNTDFPVILLNNKQSHQAVYVNDVAGARTMTNHLIEQGHQNIAFFKAEKATGTPHYSIEDRYQGYKEAMQAAGLQAHPMWNMEERGEEATQEWLYSKDRPEAIFSYNDIDAWQLCKQAYQQGLRIPDDIAIAGYNDNPAARFSWVPLTTMSVPYYQMAYTAFNQALAQINAEEPKPFDSVVVEPKLCARASTMARNRALS